MLHEYAVEPQSIGTSWETFRYVIEKFGFDKGRLISQFPKRWFEEVYGAATGLPSLQKKRIEVALGQARKNKMVRCGRAFDSSIGWIDNALVQHAENPFRAILAAANPDGVESILPFDDIDEAHPLMAVPHDCEVCRDAASLAVAMSLMLQSSKTVLFVDAYYDPFSDRYKQPFRECLKYVSPGATVEIHHLDRNGQPSAEVFEREAKNIFPGVIPEGMSVTIFRWQQKAGGEDFHARYLLTEKGGIRVDAGFSDQGAQQKTDMALMDFDLSQSKRAAFSLEGSVYELVGPVIKVNGDGDVERPDLAPGQSEGG